MSLKRLIAALVMELCLVALALNGGPHGYFGAWTWLLQMPGWLILFAPPPDTWMPLKLVLAVLVQTILWYVLFTVVTRARADRSRRGIQSMILLSVLALGACDDPAAPDPVESVRVPLGDFIVPATAAPQDTVVISFSYDDSCGPRVINVQQRSDRVEIEVRAETARSHWVCPAWVRYSRGEVRLLPFQRAPEVEVIFRQPTGADSVRRVRGS